MNEEVRSLGIDNIYMFTNVLRLLNVLTPEQEKFLDRRLISGWRL